MTLNGIDISHAQSIGEWSPAGLDFIFIKATEGSTYTDPMYAAHHAKAVAAGIPIIGSYHYANAAAPVADQVASFLRVTGGVGLLAYDTEHAEGIVSLAHMRAFAAEMHRVGKLFGGYASADRYPVYGQDWRWVAAWGVAAPSIAYHVHQYRGSPLDLDRSPLTLAQLASFGNHGGSTVTYPVPKVPSIGDVAKGAVLYTTTALDAADPKRIIIDPARSIPYHGDPVAGVRQVEYVNEAGVHSGTMYFVKAAALTNIRAVTAPPTDCTAAVAAAVAPLNAQIAALQAANATAKLDGAREEYDAIVAFPPTVVVQLPPRP